MAGGAPAGAASLPGNAETLQSVTAAIAAQSTLVAATAAVAAAKAALLAPFSAERLFWCEGIAGTASEIREARMAGLQLRAVAHLHRAQGVDHALGADPDPRDINTPGTAGGHSQPAAAPTAKAATEVAFGSAAKPVAAAKGAAKVSAKPPVPSATPAAAPAVDPALLMAELKVAAAAAELGSPLAEVALVDVSLGAPGMLFAAPPGEAQDPAADVPGLSAAPEAPQLPPPPLPPPEGAREMLAALEAVAKQAEAYDSWRQQARVHTLAAEPAVSLAHYHQLLEGLPEELISVPVVLHALTHQIAHGAALSSLQIGRALPMRGAASCTESASPNGDEASTLPTIVVEGDAIAFRAAGLTTELGVPVGPARRAGLLQALAALLPAACAPCVHARRHVEHMNARVLAQALGQAMRCFPLLSAAPWPMEDVLLVACHGEEVQQRTAGELLRPWVSFAAAWDAYVAMAGVARRLPSSTCLPSTAQTSGSQERCICDSASGTAVALRRDAGSDAWTARVTVDGGALQTAMRVTIADGSWVEMDTGGAVVMAQPYDKTIQQPSTPEFDGARVAFTPQRGPVAPEINPDGTPAAGYESWVAEAAGYPAVTGSATAVRVIAAHNRRGAGLPPLPIAPPAAAYNPRPPAALPALAVPSAFPPPPTPQRFALPRAVLGAVVALPPSPPPPVLVLRRLLKLPEALLNHMADLAGYRPVRMEAPRSLAKPALPWDDSPGSAPRKQILQQPLPWRSRRRLYPHADPRPVPGQTLCFWAAEEGLAALAGDTRRQRQRKDVSGRPRALAPALPAGHYPDAAPAAANAAYHAANAGPARMPYLARVAGRPAGADSQLTPAHLHFGEVRVGATATRTAHLLNLLPVAARFSVALPEAPVTVSYPRGPVAGGLAVALVISLVPAVAGSFVGELCITTAASLFRLTLSARFLAPPSEENAVPAQQEP
ncbi:hypothetical protein WJX81_000208 [Elliptochloris bilobata]|uniref:Uncharacterized protein n=1 Tax=Elliptochloris bilobata TaxID=381761 RepID=A0AAW1SBZ4_9CHLO